MTGLLEFTHVDNGKAEIIPFPPGHVESYDLAPSGKVTLCERIPFHTMDKKPKWSDIPLTVQPNGKLTDEDFMCKLFIIIINKSYH